MTRGAKVAARAAPHTPEGRLGPELAIEVLVEPALDLLRVEPRLDTRCGRQLGPLGRTRYDVAQALGGQFESICSQSWQTMLQNIGLDVFSLRAAWSLTRPADANSIVVRVDGVAVAQNGTNGWIPRIS